MLQFKLARYTQIWKNRQTGGYFCCFVQRYSATCITRSGLLFQKVGFDGAIGVYAESLVFWNRVILRKADRKDLSRKIPDPGSEDDETVIGQSAEGEEPFGLDSFVCKPDKMTKHSIIYGFPAAPASRRTSHREIRDAGRVHQSPFPV